MPSSCWEEQNGRELHEIAIRVRQVANGSMECQDVVALRTDIALLDKAVRDWEPGVAWTKRVDDAVLELVKACLAEARQSNWFLVPAEPHPPAC